MSSVQGLYLVLLCMLTHYRVWGRGWSRADGLSQEEVCGDVGVVPVSPLTGSSNNPAYSVRTNSSFYFPNKKIQVTVTSESPFSGFILQARTAEHGNPVGEFTLAAGSHGYSCLSNHDTLVTWYDPPRRQAVVMWTPPNHDARDILLRASFLVTSQSGEDSIHNVTSHRITKGFVPIDVSDCGTKKGCFRQLQGEESGLSSSTCDYSSCEYMVTYQKEGQAVHFEMMARAKWVAIGFSSDAAMGGDDILACKQHYGEVAVQHLWSEVGYVSPKVQTNNLHNSTAILTGEIIACRFTRLLKVPNDDRSLDLNTEWYQLYAWGPVHSGSIMLRHPKLPPTSEMQIILSHFRDVINASANHLPSYISLLATAIAIRSTVC